MKDLWFSSDNHYDHKNILKFTKDDGSPVRPGFCCVNEMNERMIANHNSVVKPGDHWYCLGDFCMGNKTVAGRIIQRLHGRKRITVGNHDDIKEIVPFFEKAYMWRIFKEFNFFCMHVPQSKEVFRYTKYQVHGHIHANVMDDPQYINVCVEHIDYTPVHLEWIIEQIKQRES